jgi:hypothetical protein
MNQRLYGLFERHEGRWIRVEGTGAYPKKVAVRVFQNALLAPFLGIAPHERCLKPFRSVAEALIRDHG